MTLQWLEKSEYLNLSSNEAWVTTADGEQFMRNWLPERVGLSYKVGYKKPGAFLTVKLYTFCSAKFIWIKMRIGTVSLCKGDKLLLTRPRHVTAVPCLFWEFIHTNKTASREKIIYINHWVTHPVARVSTNICRNLHTQQMSVFVLLCTSYTTCFGPYWWPSSSGL
jgi:hypothetical protein